MVIFSLTTLLPTIDGMDIYFEGRTVKYISFPILAYVSLPKASEAAKYDNL